MSYSVKRGKLRRTTVSHVQADTLAYAERRRAGGNCRKVPMSSGFQRLSAGACRTAPLCIAWSGLKWIRMRPLRPPD